VTGKQFIRCGGTVAVKGVRGRTIILTAMTLAAMALATATASASPEYCDIRLHVELTPDVPDPSDMGFLGSLLGNQVDYELTLRRERDDSDIVLELTGPGPEYRCRQAIETIRRDGRVLSVHVRRNES
jgi:hypothetical protein